MMANKDELKESLKNHPKLLGYIFATMMFLSAGVGTALATGGTTAAGP
jgi:hypothetical protein